MASISIELVSRPSLVAALLRALADVIDDEPSVRTQPETETAGASYAGLAPGACPVCAEKGLNACQCEDKEATGAWGKRVD